MTVDDSMVLSCRGKKVSMVYNATLSFYTVGLFTAYRFAVVREQATRRGLLTERLRCSA